MVKKLFYLLTALVFLFAFTIATTPVFAQEEEEKPVEDIEEFSLEELLNVEITTAGKRAEKVGEIPASVVLVTREDIETYGYQTLSEVLESIPGLYLVDDAFSKNFGVRGFWTTDPQRNVIILVNNVKQTEGLSNSHFLEQINMPVEAIDRIEVVRGPMSVIYGTGAFFGAINIKTNQLGEKEEPVSMVTGSVGSEKTFKIFARSSGKSGDFQYSFNGNYLDTEGMDIAFSDMTSNPRVILPALGVAVDATTKEKLENKEKFFNFSGLFKGFSLDMLYTEDGKGVLPVLPPVEEGTILTHKNFRLNFGYNIKFSEKARMEGTLGYFVNSMNFEWDLLIPNFYGVQLNKSSGYSAELNLFFDPSPKVNISFGLEYRNFFEVVNEYNIPLFFGSNNIHNKLADGESIATQSIFTQINFKLSERFKIVAGARVEQVPEYIMEHLVGGITDIKSLATFSYTKAEFIPRLALIWSIDENNYLKFLYGKAINRPSFFQSLDLLNFPESTPLEPETIQTFELNYLGSLSPKFSVSLSLFRNMMDKLIYRTLYIVGGVVTSYFGNVGEMSTNGVEVTIKAIPSKYFQLEISGTYQDSTDKRFENIDVGYSPKFLGYLKASVLFNKDISIAVSGNYISEMESFYDETLNGGAGARLGQKVDGYFLLGANFRVRNLFGTGLFLNLRGSNLLDKVFLYPATSNNNTYADKGVLGRGMSLLLTVGYRFIPIPRP